MEVPRPALRPTPLTCRSGSKVAILFDWENVPVGAAGTEARRNAIKAILALASTYGDIVYACAFADFDLAARRAPGLHEPTRCVRVRPRGADRAPRGVRGPRRLTLPAAAEGTRPSLPPEPSSRPGA